MANKKLKKPDRKPRSTFKKRGLNEEGLKPQKKKKEQERYDFGAGTRKDGTKVRPEGRGQDRSYNKDSRTGVDVIAGKHAVLEALESGVPLKSVFIAQGTQEGDYVDKVIERCKESGVEYEVVPRKKIDYYASGLNHQGVMAKARPYQYAAIGDIMAACEGEESALVYVLDHITDVGNFGAIVRSAEVVGAAGIVIPAKRSVDVVASTYKTSAGAVSRMKIAKVSNIATACDRLRDNGFWVAGASEKAEQACWDAPLKGKVGLVMGSEGDGISRIVQKKCDLFVKLPQRGEIGSLNVSCAAAALGYEWLRQNYEG